MLLGRKKEKSGGLRQWLKSKLDMQERLIKNLSSEQINELILNQTLNNLLYVNKCEIVDTKEKGDITIFIPLVNKMYSDKYDKLSEKEKIKDLVDFVNLMGKYMGLKVPDVIIDTKEKVEFEVDGITDPTKQFAVDVSYGASSMLNDIYLSFFTENFFTDCYNKNFNADMVKLNLIASYIVTIRHEFQHLQQFANLKHISDDNTLNDKNILTFCSVFMNESLSEHKLVNGFDLSDLIGVTYFAEYIEYDARQSEFNFLNDLIACDGLSANAKEGLARCLCEEILKGCRPFKDFGPMSGFVNLSLKYAKVQFEKIFGANELAQRILNLYNFVDKENVMMDINFDELKVIEKEYLVDKLLSTQPVLESLGNEGEYNLSHASRKNKMTPNNFDMGRW